LVCGGWYGDAGLPSADDVVELSDELAIERLLEHLTEGRRATFAGLCTLLRDWDRPECLNPHLKRARW
jgi:hypothetical protein